MKKQVHVFYSGRVQGVGFRYTARDIAGNMGVCGWVKNLSDGRVELTIEDEEDVLNAFLEKINKYFSQYIQDIQTEWLPATGEFKDFQIEL